MLCLVLNWLVAKQNKICLKIRRMTLLPVKSASDNASFRQLCMSYRHHKHGAYLSTVRTPCLAVHNDRVFLVLFLDLFLLQDTGSIWCCLIAGEHSPFAKSCSSGAYQTGGTCQHSVSMMVAET